ncbi:Hypothetical predicted protein [Mytilus galloprovincialis]|uniref:Neuralized pats1 n=1 Tax=Mytilus galloprovincialis TaxID=29158 RepID=A0A8B6CV01_MYTGA|nr:Hypothetical predicted protein [Mytilus galloprovincialis]
MKHWVDSVLSYTEDTEDIMPMIMFAATHRDQCKGNTAKIKEQFIKDINQMFSEHENKNHIHLDTVYFINGIDKNDTEIQRMTDQVVVFAMQQSSWGQRRPMQWVPLELQISNMRLKNINIISKEDIRNVNNLNDDLALNERQLEDFLIVQHSLGKVMYYSLPGLDNFIIIHPPALVNILRSFVTDKIFFPADKTLKSILKNLTKTGKIYKGDLLKLWQQDNLHQYMPDDDIKEFVVQLLIHLDILIIPKTQQKTIVNHVYLVPCMIKAFRPAYFVSLDGHQKKTTICMQYYLDRNSIPTALAYKVIGAILNAWPLKYEKKHLCLYHKAALLTVSDDIELRIWIEDNRIVVYMTHEKSLIAISPDVAASVQECLTKNLDLSLLFHYNSFGRKIKPTKVSELYRIEFGIPCGRSVCYVSSQEVSKIETWECLNGKKHDTRYLRNWVFNKDRETCGPECKGLNDIELKTEPDDKHLVRLGSQIGIKSFGEFFINLGMKRKDWESTEYTYAGHSSEGIMSMALKQWKKFKISKLETPTLQNLSDALTAVNLDRHVICQVDFNDLIYLTTINKPNIVDS